MNVFLTGASGFIGRNIKESYLSDKHTVFAPYRSELDLCDTVAVERFFSQNSIDVVIHSAVKPGHRNAADATSQAYTNLRMFFNLVRNETRFGKFLFLSSGSVYDAEYYQPKMQEEYFDTHVPVDEHGFPKYVAAKFSEQFGKITELRLFGVFGKYEDYAIRFISNAICKAICDLPITIRQNRRFDYLYIDDLMPVLDHFIDNHVKHSAYNVTPNFALDLLTIAEMVKVRSGKNLPILLSDSSMGLEYSGANDRLRREMSGITFTPIEAAIDKLYCWYEANASQLDRHSLLVDK